MANNEVQQYIMRAIQNATGDDLERARAAFKGLTPEVMAQDSPITEGAESSFAIAGANPSQTSMRTWVQDRLQT